MYVDALYTRKVYGDVYATFFDDGTIVPWKPLSIKDYIDYDVLLQSGKYVNAYIEDEIFCKCVLDKVLVNNIDDLKAGIVGAVSQSILEYSGPASSEELDNFLNIKRNESTNILHQIVSWICLGFPAYTPDDLYDMEYQDLMLRLALSEEKLLRSGVITEPFSFFNKGEEQQKKKKLRRPPPPTPKPPKQNIAQQYKQQQERTIITKADIIESSIGMDGHSKDEVAHHKIAEETAKLYPEYLDQMKKGEKVSIPSVEERKRAAEARAKANELKYKESLKQNKEYTKTELERLKIIREQERKRRAKLRNK